MLTLEQEERIENAIEAIAAGELDDDQACMDAAMDALIERLLAHV